MTSYFIRYTANPQADLERGYSFVGYNLFNTKELALETLAEYAGEAFEDEFDADSWNDENAHRVAQDNTTGMWGTRRSGLCGFGEFDSVEDAIENMDSNQYHGTQFCAIFEGRKTYDQELDGHDDGMTFRPTRIAALFEMEGNEYVRIS